MKQTISVAMTTFNGARYLHEQLASIAEQTRQADEIVVCDDGSSDDTVAILEAFAARSSIPIKLFCNERTLGSNKNFEKAVAHCRGDIVALADQDDVWLPHKLERLVTGFQAEEVGLVFSDAALVDARLQPLGLRLWQVYRFDAKAQRAFARGQALEVLVNRTVVTGATMAFRARYKEAVLPFMANSPNMWWVHDAWIAVIIAALARLAFIPEPLMLYRQHGNNQIGAKRRTLGEQLAEISMKNKARRHLAEYRHAYQRLRQLHERGYTLDAATLDFLEEKNCHLEIRAQLPQTLSGRLAPIIQETGNRRYFRFSSGWKSMIKDLLYHR